MFNEIVNCLEVYRFSIGHWAFNQNLKIDVVPSAKSITISVSYCSNNFILYFFRRISKYCRRCGTLMPTNYEMIHNSVNSPSHNDDLYAHLCRNHKIWMISFLHWAIEIALIREEFPQSNVTTNMEFWCHCLHLSNGEWLQWQ